MSETIKRKNNEIDSLHKEV